MRAAEALWVSRGINGVPAVVVEGKYLISGGQPAGVFEEALRGWRGRGDGHPHFAPAAFLTPTVQLPISGLVRSEFLPRPLVTFDCVPCRVREHCGGRRERRHGYLVAPRGRFRVDLQRRMRDAWTLKSEPSHLLRRRRGARKVRVSR